MRSSTKIVLAMVGVGMLLAGATLVSLFVWRGVGQDGTAEPAELRTYQVPPDYQDDLRGMLDSVLRVGDTRLGRVTKGPGGTLLVVAPSRLQDGIRDILDTGFEVSPLGPVKLTYWLVVGRPVDGVPAGEPFSVRGRRGVPQLEPVFRQIATVQGATEFALLEEIQITSMSQDQGRAFGKFARVEQTATRTGDAVVAFVSINLVVTGNMFASQVVLEPGQFLVVGQAGFGGNPQDVFPDATPEDLLTLYYVMAADLEP